MLCIIQQATLADAFVDSTGDIDEMEKRATDLARFVNQARGQR
jgi:hypothetical protein